MLSSKPYSPPPYIPLITPTEWKYLYYRLLGYDNLEISKIVERNHSTVKNVMRQLRFKISSKTGNNRINAMEICIWLSEWGFVDEDGKVIDDRFMRMKWKEIFKNE